MYFFSMAPRHGEWKIPVHIPAHMKPCFKKVPRAEEFVNASQQRLIFKCT